MTSPFKIALALPCHRLSTFVVGLLLIGGIAPAYSQDKVELKIRNTAVGSAVFEIKSLRSLTPNNPWRTVTVSPNRTVTFPIASPDDYIVRATADGVKYETTAIPLKAWITKNPNFELTLSRIAAAPQGMVAPVGLGLRFDPPPLDPQPGAGEHIPFNQVGGARPFRRLLPRPIGNGGQGNVGAAAPR